MKVGLGYKKQQNKKKRFEKPNYQKKTNFVHETSSEEEKELQFRRQSNEEFYTQKKQQQQVKYVSKKTCFKCDQTGHVSRKCPNQKPVGVEQKRQPTEAVKQESTKFESQQTWKPKSKTSIVESKQIWKQNVDFQKSNQTWKTKPPSLSQNKSGNQKLIQDFIKERCQKVKFG
ncbi:putative transcription factor interactor and regulator CCHC(Zn) family [Helianthus anomalus]